jgi:hypothetical protein
MLLKDFILWNPLENASTIVGADASIVDCTNIVLH